MWIFLKVFYAGVAKPGQRREIRYVCPTRCSDVMNLTGLPHPVGVRGFESHPPHPRTFFYNIILGNQLRYPRRLKDMLIS